MWHSDRRHDRQWHWETETELKYKSGYKSINQTHSILSSVMNSQSVSVCVCLLGLSAQVSQKWQMIHNDSQMIQWFIT